MDDQCRNKIDIVVPCYNEELCIPIIFEEVTNVLSSIDNYSYSFIFVDDGSKDKTLEKIKELLLLHGREVIKYVTFTRNFGKEAAIYAGLEASSGDYVVLMDADMQDPPYLIPEMLTVIEAGYDCCATRRTNRNGEPPIRSLFANMFYRLVNSICNVKLESGSRDFRMMSRQMVNSFLLLDERERFTKGLFPWVGYNTKWISYENAQRVAGKSTWSFYKLFTYAIGGIVAFTTAPLRFATILGLLMVLSTIIFGGRLFVMAVFLGTNHSGFTTLLTMMLFLGGVITSLLGVIGEYLARIYNEVKKRPVYIAKETNINAR